MCDQISTIKIGSKRNFTSIGITGSGKEPQPKSPKANHRAASPNENDGPVAPQSPKLKESRRIPLSPRKEDSPKNPSIQSQHAKSKSVSSSVKQNLFSPTLPAPTRLMLGNLENYASPPDLSVFETRKLSDKIRSYITGLPEPFQTTFNHHLENMKKGADLELTQTDIDLIFKDTAFNETNGFLSYFSRYSQMPIDRYGKTPTVTVKKEIAVLNSLSLEIHNKLDPSWNGFNQTQQSIPNELQDLLPFIGPHEDYPSNLSIEIPKPNGDLNYAYLSYTSEPFNPSTLALAESTQITLGMEKSQPLKTVRLFDGEHNCIMSAQLTPSNLFLLHTIDTKGTTFCSQRILSLSQLLANVLKAKGILLYDAAKIYFPGTNEHYFYTKAMLPKILNETKPAFYANPLRGNFNFYESNTAVLDGGHIHCYEGIETARRMNVFNEGFNQNMNTFKALITKSKIYENIPDDKPLIEVWDSLLDAYLMSRRKPEFTKLVRFLNDLTSIKDLPQNHPKFESTTNFRDAIESWAQPEFYMKTL